MLVQLIFWFNLGVVFPTIGLGIPFTSITFWSRPTSELISPFTAALLGLGLNKGAYMSEIVRSGIISVDVGQSEAALAVGMTRGQIMRHIVQDPRAGAVKVQLLPNEETPRAEQGRSRLFYQVEDCLYRHASRARDAKMKEGGEHTL